MGIINLYARIGVPPVEDEYLTRNSMDFHTHLGYQVAGTFRRCGYKFERWYDMVWMEKFDGGLQLEVAEKKRQLGGQFSENALE